MLWERRQARAAEPERRETTRLDKAFHVYVEGERGPGLGIARNISRGGIFVETRAPQPIGSQVRITFPSESGNMHAVAEVRYVCHLLGLGHGALQEPRAVRGMGLRFLYFEAGDERAAPGAELSH
jgi:hypothetical protein